MSGKTHVKSLVDTPFLGQWDLAKLPPGRDAVVKIVSVERYVPERPKKDEKFKRVAIGFERKRKKWIAGPVSIAALTKMFGPYIEDWIGQRIALYVDASVMFGRETTGGVRVRPTRPKADQAPTDDPLDSAPDPEKEQQIERAREQAQRQPGED